MDDVVNQLQQLQRNSPDNDPSSILCTLLQRTHEHIKQQHLLQIQQLTQEKDAALAAAEKRIEELERQNADLHRANELLRVHNSKITQFRDLVIHASQHLDELSQATNNNNSSSHHASSLPTVTVTSSIPPSPYYFQANKHDSNDRISHHDLHHDSTSNNTRSASQPSKPVDTSFLSPTKYHSSFSPMPRLSPSALASPPPPPTPAAQPSASAAAAAATTAQGGARDEEHMTSPTHAQSTHPLLDEIQAHFSPHKPTVYKSHYPYSSHLHAHPAHNNHIYSHHISKLTNPVSTRVMDQLFSPKPSSSSPPSSSVSSISSPPGTVDEQQVARIKLLFHDARCRLNDQEFQRFFQLSKMKNIQAYNHVGEWPDKHRDLILRLFEIKQAK